MTGHTFPSQNPSDSSRHSSRRQITAYLLAIFLLVISPRIVSAQPLTIDFDSQIVPLLTKVGCNAGACHGAASGRGRFKLSLFGSRPEEDYKAIVFADSGRRVNLAEPQSSLLIAKPTESIGHEGGTLFGFESLEAKLLEHWIAQGAERTATRHLADFKLVNSEFIVKSLPARIEVHAIASWKEHPEEDVTYWSRFEIGEGSGIKRLSTHELEVTTAGIHSIQLRFLDRIATLRIVVPFKSTSEIVSVGETETVGATNWLDAEVQKQLELLQLRPGKRADRTTLRRRVHLILTGQLPSAESAEVANSLLSEEEYEKLVDSLLASPEFEEYWTWQLAKWFRVPTVGNEPAVSEEGFRYLRQVIAEDRSLRDVSSEIISSSGDSHALGALAFYRAGGDARAYAERFSEVFMGVRMRCANCHDHPLDRWNQDDYHGLAAIMAKVTRTRQVRDAKSGETIHPATNLAATPKLPGVSLAEAESIGRRELADWLAIPTNPYFAKNVVNRIWKGVFGLGLTEPVDDLRATNLPLYPALLSVAEAKLVANDFRLRPFLRELLVSETFQRESTRDPEKSQLSPYYAYYPTHQLSPEVLIEAIAKVTETEISLPGFEGSKRIVTKPDLLATRNALEFLADSNSEGSCTRCAPETELSLRTALHLLNGDLINKRLQNPASFLQRENWEAVQDSEITQRIFQKILNRSPSLAEREFWISEFKQAREQMQLTSVVVDAAWTLITSDEFLSVH